MQKVTLLAADSAPVQRVSVRFAAFINAQKEQISSEWLSAILRDKDPSSARVNLEPLLVEHILKLLEGLEKLLRSPAGELIGAEAIHDAQEHGVHRFVQGYDLGEMLREFAEFRTVLVEHMGVFAEGDSQFIGRTQSFAASRVHRFLDESARWSTVPFVEERHVWLLTANESRLNLLRVVSHEMGNALNGISLAARLLRKATNSEIHEIEQALRRGVQFMKEMIDDLRSLASLDAGNEKLTIMPFAPHVLVQDIAAAYRVLAEEKGLKFTCETDASLLEVVGDQRRTKQVAVNLVSNAIKYTAAGEVRVEVQSVDAEWWKIAVTDTGVGIAPEHQQKVFNEFFRVDATSIAEGMGLGLAVALRLVQLLGGETRMKSTLGKGSCFEAIFPKIISADALK